MPKEIEPTPQTSTATVAHRGNTQSTLLSQTHSSNYWIVDTGALDHITGSSNFFSTYEDCAENIMILVADRSVNGVVG